MASDRFVVFSNRVPTKDEVQRILENYTAGCGTVKLHESEKRPGVHWWLVDFPGVRTQLFDGINGARPYLYGDEAERLAESDRWFEVILSEPGSSDEGSYGPNVDILTRHQDDFTCGLADRLADAFARFYRGRRIH